MCATMDRGKFQINRMQLLWKNNEKLFFFSGNVVGSQPYTVGTPACSNFGMHPSAKYSGLCASTQTVYTPNNQVITQNTYTIKTERINPTIYQPATYNSYIQPQSNAIQAYQHALQVYQNPSQTYQQAQQNYQLALQAYNRAYAQPHVSTSSYSYTPSKFYDWSAYFG